MQEIRAAVKANSPLIHCITNPISINQCANAILAVGARPMMAEHPDQVAEPTQTAQALLCNLGNITDARMQSIQIASATAAIKNIPVVLDLVGIACSALRRSFAQTLLEKHIPKIIKGNASEIHALYDTNYKSAGVDADTTLDFKKTANIAARLAKKYGTVLLVSGKVDIITDGKTVACVYNGTPQLATVTGTGCMLGALCACYLSSADAFSAAKTACIVLNISGQLAETSFGSGSFMLKLMDKISALTDEDIDKHIKLEVYEHEKL